MMWKLFLSCLLTLKLFLLSWINFWAAGFQGKDFAVGFSVISRVLVQLRRLCWSMSTQLWSFYFHMRKQSALESLGLDSWGLAKGSEMWSLVYEWIPIVSRWMVLIAPTCGHSRFGRIAVTYCNLSDLLVEFVSFKMKLVHGHVHMCMCYREIDLGNSIFNIWLFIYCHVYRDTVKCLFCLLFSRIIPCTSTIDPLLEHYYLATLKILIHTYFIDKSK